VREHTKKESANGLSETSEKTDERRQQRKGEVRFYTVTDVASHFAVSVRSVRRWIADKKLAAHHFGSAVRIAESDLRAFIAMHRDI
jgi:excisionase family DNA binding protein